LLSGFAQPGQSDGGEEDEGASGTAPAQLDNATSILLRLFKAGGLDLGMVSSGGTISSAEELRQALDNLDSVPGNVTLDSTTDRDGDGNPDLLFTVAVVGKEIGGIVRLSIDSTVLGGQVSVNGSLQVKATVDLSVSFGVDSKGFFILPSGTTESALKITHLEVDGEVTGRGRIGFLGVDMDHATLSMDPDAAVTIKLVDPGTIASDGTIRAAELNHTGPPALLTASVTGHPGGPADLLLTGTFGVSAIVPGFEDNLHLADADLALSWADLSQPGQVDISSSDSAGQAILTFLHL